eukprot:1149683-Pelagomonas_calceolata.AAC.10
MGPAWTCPPLAATPCRSEAEALKPVADDAGAPRAHQGNAIVVMHAMGGSVQHRSGHCLLLCTFSHHHATWDVYLDIDAPRERTYALVLKQCPQFQGNSTEQIDEAAQQIALGACLVRTSWAGNKEIISHAPPCSFS